MARAVVAILGLVVVGFLAVQGLDAGLATAGDTRDIDSESWTPNAGSITDLANSNLENAYYTDQVEVFDSNDNRMVDGDDYIWYEQNGTIKTVTGGDLDGESSATINYEFQITSENDRAIGKALSVLPRFIEVGILLGGAILLLLFLKGVS